MIRRKRIKLFRISLLGLVVLIAGVALLPAGLAHTAAPAAAGIELSRSP